MKRILITGASGFIGSTLADHALAKGWEVTAAVRPTSDRSHLTDPRIRFVNLHFDNEPALRHELEQAGRFDYVAHIAGTTKALNPAEYFRINTEYTKRFVDILRQDALRPDCFLFLSSLAALGPAVGGAERVTPQQPPTPVTTYGESKLAAERYLESLSDFPWTVVQPTAVFGPRDRDILEFVGLVNKGLELYIGSTPQRGSFIFVDDLVSIMLAALESGLHRRKYIAADNSRDYTTDDLGAATRTALQKRTLRLHLPIGIVRIVAAVLETIGRWRGQMPPLNREKLNEISNVNWWCDTKQTWGDLGIAPQDDLYSGMQKTVRWYRENGWL